jgi:hypothetical protein
VPWQYSDVLYYKECRVDMVRPYLALITVGPMENKCQSVRKVSYHTAQQKWSVILSPVQEGK